jgi:hypothetical protein
MYGLKPVPFTEIQVPGQMLSGKSKEAGSSTTLRFAQNDGRGRAPVFYLTYNRKAGGTPMQITPAPLRPAQAEVHRAAHDQDLIEVPKRARLDREAEGKREQKPSPAASGPARI